MEASSSCGPISKPAEEWGGLTGIFIYIFGQATAADFFLLQLIQRCTRSRKSGSRHRSSYFMEFLFLVSFSLLLPLFFRYHAAALFLLLLVPGPSEAAVNFLFVALFIVSLQVLPLLC